MTTTDQPTTQPGIAPHAPAQPCTAPAALTQPCAAAPAATQAGPAGAATVQTRVAHAAGRQSAVGPNADRPVVDRPATAPAGAGPARRRSIAVALVLAGALSVHSGAAVATSQFSRAGIGPLVAMRLIFGAVILMALCRPALRNRTRADWALVVSFGAVLAGMNSIFYVAIDRIPLGLAVTLEVLGPLALSVATAHRRIACLWALLAAGGVAVLGWDGLGRLDPLGVTLALVAGAFWAAYILLSARVGRRFAGADGLALAMVVAGLLSLPFGLLGAGPATFDLAVLGLGALVGLLSSAVPYSLEMVALRTLPTGTFAILMSLGPAVATLAGLAILGQSLTAYEALAMALIIAASMGAVRTGAK